MFDFAFFSFSHAIIYYCNQAFGVRSVLDSFPNCVHCCCWLLPNMFMIFQTIQNEWRQNVQFSGNLSFLSSKRPFTGTTKYTKSFLSMGLIMTGSYLIFVTCTTCSAGVKISRLVSKNSSNYGALVEGPFQKFLVTSSLASKKTRR